MEYYRFSPRQDLGCLDSRDSTKIGKCQWIHMYLSIKYTGLRHGLEEGVNRKELMHVTYRFLASTIRWSGKYAIY